MPNTSDRKVMSFARWVGSPLTIGRMTTRSSVSEYAGWLSARIFCPVRSRISPRFAGMATGRSALASERLRYLSACTPCTNQNDPARKTKTAMIDHKRALIRKVRNFWSSRYTRMESVSRSSGGLDRLLPQEQRQQLIHQHPEQRSENGFDDHGLLEHLDALLEQDVDQHENHQLIHDDGSEQTRAEHQSPAQDQSGVDVGHHIPDHRQRKRVQSEDRH